MMLKSLRSSNRSAECLMFHIAPVTGELCVCVMQMISDLNTYLNKAVPDTRLTIKKYLDTKFEYLVSGCQCHG